MSECAWWSYPPRVLCCFWRTVNRQTVCFLAMAYSLQYLRIARGDARAIAETDWLGFCPAYQELAAFSRCDLGHHQAEADARTYE
jgi:hypothetical protein